MLAEQRIFSAPTDKFDFYFCTIILMIATAMAWGGHAWLHTQMLADHVFLPGFSGPGQLTYSAWSTSRQAGFESRICYYDETFAKAEYRESRILDDHGQPAGASFTEFVGAKPKTRNYIIAIIASWMVTPLLAYGWVKWNQRWVFETKNGVHINTETGEY